MPALLRKPSLRNPLAYPVGAMPGFDPTHRAAFGVFPGHGFSGVASGGSFYSLLTGTPGVPVSTPTGAILAGIGPCTNYPSLAISTTFGGQSTATETQGTIASIFQMNAASAATSAIFNNSGTGAGVGMYSSSAGKLGFLSLGSASIASALAIAANVPYFAAVSNGPVGASCYFVLANLATGAVLMETQARTTIAGASNGTYNLGNTQVSNRPLNGKIAAVMFSPFAVSLDALLQWAADPWAFWYPRNIDLTAIEGPSTAAFLAAWAMNSNLPVIGTGTY